MLNNHHKIRIKIQIITSLVILSLSFPAISFSAESGRFLDNGNGTVTDSKTGLMWAAGDNGEDIDFEDALRYCESFSAAGFSDWRLPDIEELKNLFDAGASKTGLGITEKISLTSCCPWSSYDSTGVSSMLDFRNGKEIWGFKGDKELLRALPVRQGDNL